jgi:2-amino-4-hydroxy-6-hydroxymethyldihydropteridine diphosphokinase
MSKVFLALGSNKGDREAYLFDAIKSLMDDEKIRLIKCSSIYETKPYGTIPQNNYLNGAVLIETDYTPNEIYTIIKKIEKEVGRTDSVRWGEREIDIDIILIDSLIFENDKIIIPHKEYDKRDFVLVPIHEIDNELIDPKSKIKIENLIKLLDERYIIDKVELNLNLNLVN